jgi:hypothetical protein
MQNAANSVLRWRLLRMAGAIEAPGESGRRPAVQSKWPRKRSRKSPSALEKAGVEFIPENGGGAGMRLAKKSRRPRQAIDFNSA